METNGFSKLKNEFIFTGASGKLFFHVTDEKGTPVSLEKCLVYWTLTRKGQKKTPLIIKDNDKRGGIVMVNSEQGEFMVEIKPDDTINLGFSVYEQEYVIKQQITKENTHRPAWGNIYVREGSNIN